MTLLLSLERPADVSLYTLDLAALPPVELRKVLEARFEEQPVASALRAMGVLEASRQPSGAVAAEARREAPSAVVAAAVGLARSAAEKHASWQYAGSPPQQTV